MSNQGESEVKALVKYALAEIEDRKSHGLKIVRLAVSRHTHSKGGVKGLRDELKKDGYRTKIQRGSGNVIVEWD